MKNKMKKFFLSLIAVVLLATISFAQNVPSYVPMDGLVGWWPFNGDARDESGNGNDGVVNGATLSNDRFGTPNKAFSFDGLSNYIHILNSDILNFTKGTINIWISSSQTYFMNLIEKNIYTDGSNENWAMGINQNGFGDISFYTKHNSNCTPGIGWQTNIVNLNLQTSSWHMITGVINSNSTELFYDGILVNTFITPTLMDICNGDIQIARHWANDPRYYLGKLDDIGIWNRALTQQEIATLFESSINVGINVNNPQYNLHIKDVMKLEPRDAAPLNPTKGVIYFDNSLNKLRVYNGTDWESL